MTIALLVVMVALLVAVELWLEHRRRVRAPDQAGLTLHRHPRAMTRPFVPSGTFVAPSHIWLRFARDGSFMLGIDTLLGGAVGTLRAVELPSIGTQVRRGEPLVTLETASGSLVLPAPADGEIAAINEAVLKDPRDVSSDPYGLGWLLRLRPVDHKAALEPLFVGDGAIAFVGREYRRLVDLVTTMAAPHQACCMADGGVLEQGVLQVLGGVGFEAFQRAFLDES